MIDKTLLRTKLLLRFSIILTIVAWFVFILHHYVGFLQAQIMLRNGQLMTEQAYMIVVGLLLSVTVLQIICFFTYKKNALHDHLPMLISVTMTLTSITIIAAGNGLTEYHFSIFVVMALITMFQKRRLIIHSSMTFVAQHLFGYFFFPELLCGTEGYSFSLLGIHAFFLVGITLAALSMIRQLNITEKQHEELQAASAEKIQALLVEVKEVSALVQEDANDLEHQRGLVMEASNEIAAAVQQTSTQVDETTQLVECADENGQQLRQQMTNIQTITNDIADEATLATKLALQGASSLQDIANQHHTIEESLSMLHELVNDVVENSKYITTEAQVIENVSEQTKLLALNASIEAARAGENGKGFQVVATEVHKLATNSKEATTEILKFIYMIHEKIIHVQEAMQQNKQEVKKGEQLVQATESTFSDIVTQAKNMEQETATINAIIHSTAELTRDMNEAFQMILGANEELSTVSRRALLTSEEQLDQMYELEQVTIRLNTIVEQLNKLMVTSES